MISTILLSTAFTFFTTVSCSIRPDFPSPNDSKLRILSTKLNIIFWALLCPEVVLFWAVRQWFEAGEVAKEFQDRGWTRQHGLFLLMGGFILCNKDGQPTKTISFPHFKRLVRGNVIDFPHLTSFKIQERSNLHPALVFIALLQALWFVAQCLFRFIQANPTGQGLPVITQLEAITASIVITNWCIFFFVWQKPLDARYPILIKPNVNPSNSPNHGQPQRRGIIGAESFEREQNISQVTERQFQLDCPHGQMQSTSLSKSISKLRCTHRTFISILIWPVRSFCEDLVQSLPSSVTSDSHEFSDGTLKIPLFYVHTTMLDFPVLLLVAVLGMGVSIISFLFLLRSRSTLPFPSDSAKLVWRIASIITTSFSALTLGLTILTTFFRYLDSLLPRVCCCIVENLTVFFLFIGFCVLTIGFVPLFLARVVLLVSSVIFCFSIPGEDAFASQQSQWMDYIPHFS